MKKVIILFVLLIGLLSISSIKVNADSLKSHKRFDNTIITYEEEADVSCDGILTQDGYDMVREILGYIRIIAPVLAIILIALDLASAVFSQDNDSLNKATKKIIPRLIGVVLLFFVPTIIRAILGIDGIKDSIVISDDPLCGTMQSIPIDINDYELTY